jgi:thiamine-monophosphate kinase
MGQRLDDGWSRGMGDMVGQLGEKRLLKDLILPLVNPQREHYLSGDDCGMVDVPDGHLICVSTDRVPWDLTAYRLKIMSEFDLGYYLAVLNISDIAAMGAVPAGLLLNLAMPADYPVASLQEVIKGAQSASVEFSCPILGGDLSDSSEPSFCATSIGLAKRGEYLLRRGAEVGDSVYMSGPCGLSAAAFRYFLNARSRGMKLTDDDYRMLCEALARPTPQLNSSQALARYKCRATAMDNTDGLSQSLFELAETNDLHYMVDAELLPIHRLAYEVGAFLGEDPIDLSMGPGADLNLVGTVNNASIVEELGMYRIGAVEKGGGISLLEHGKRREIQPNGWNYFLEKRKVQ